MATYQALGERPASWIHQAQILAATAAFMAAAVGASPASAVDEEGAASTGSRVAVDATNATVSVAYELQRLEFEIDNLPATLDVNEHGYLIEAGLTIPIRDRLGLRWGLVGGQSWIEDGSPALDRITALTSFFLRDPNLGEVGLGYQFAWFDRESFHGTGHGLVFDSSLFWGSTDLDLRLSWLRTDQTALVFSFNFLPLLGDFDADQVDLSAGPRFYAGDRLSFAPKFVYQRIDTEGSFFDNTASAFGVSLAGELLAGPAGSNMVTLGVDFDYLADGLGPRVDRDRYRVVASITILTLPVADLRTLNRQRR